MSLERSIAVGLGCYFRDRTDLLAAGFPFGCLSGFPAAPDGFQDGTIIEILYRRQLGGGLMFTPDLQLIFNSAYERENDDVRRPADPGGISGQLPRHGELVQMGCCFGFSELDR